MQQKLFCAGCFDPETRKGLPVFPPGACVIWERPNLRTGGGSKRKATPDDLITLGYRAGRAVGLCPAPERVVAVSPSTWKGSLSKPVSHARTLKACPRAAEFLTGKKSDEDLLDAVGLGLWALPAWEFLR